MTQEPLRSVAGVTNPAEADMLKNMLAEEGIPAILRPQNLYVSALQAAGPHSVLVKEADYERAREIIYGSPLPDGD